MPVKNERGEEGVIATPRDVLDLLSVRKHEVYVSVYSLISLLQTSERVTASLRHLVECNGDCRKALKGGAASSLAENLVNCYGGVFDEDSGEAPPDYQENLSEGDEARSLYTLCSPKELSALLLRGGALHVLIEDISNVRDDELGTRIAVSAGRLVERFGNQVYSLVERALETSMPGVDPLTFLASWYSTLVDVLDQGPEVPVVSVDGGSGDLERQIKEALDQVFGVRAKKPDDPDVN